jgi:hypothetical protein
MPGTFEDLCSIYRMKLSFQMVSNKFREIVQDTNCLRGWDLTKRSNRLILTSHFRADNAIQVLKALALFEVDQSEIDFAQALAVTASAFDPIGCEWSAEGCRATGVKHSLAQGLAGIPLDS